MCRAGGRRCPGNGVSTTKAHVNARQRLSRARRAYEKALAGTDPSKAEAAQQKLVAAESAMDAVRKAHTHDNPAQKGDVTPVEPQTPPSLDAQILAAYRALAVKTQDWIRLARIRARLTSVDKREIDAALLTMMRAGTIYLAPDSNRKVLTAEDHAAAIMIGGEPKHLLAVDAEVDLDAGVAPAGASTSAAPSAESAQPGEPSATRPAPKRTQKKAGRRAQRPQPGDVTSKREDTPPQRQTRRWDGKPETESDMRLRILRESGYTGPVDQDGYPVVRGNAVEILQALANARGGTAAAHDTPTSEPEDHNATASDDNDTSTNDTSTNGAPPEDGGTGGEPPNVDHDEPLEDPTDGGRPRVRVHTGPGGMHMVNIAHAGAVVGMQTDVNFGDVAIGPDGGTTTTGHTTRSAAQAVDDARKAAAQAERHAARATRRAQRATQRAQERATHATQQAERLADGAGDTDDEQSCTGWPRAGMTMTNIVDGDHTVVIQNGLQFGDIRFGSGKPKPTQKET